MKVIFMGTPDYAQAILQALINDEEIEIVAVYTQPDKPVGRKKIMTPPVVKTLALNNGLNIFQPNRLRDEETVQELLQIQCDYIVVAAYGQILPKEILDYVPCINLHASILPQYRGASPIQQTLLNNDTQTGVTAMLMDVGLDTGDILTIEKIDVDSDEMVENLFYKLTQVASNLTLQVLKNFNNYIPNKQNNELATHCKKITKSDGEINFDDAEAIYNKYRAFTPWPGVYLENGLKIKKMSLENKNNSYKSGQILEVNKDSIVIGCIKGSVRIFNVQAPSKKEVDIISYINGKRLSCEDYLS